MARDSLASASASVVTGRSRRTYETSKPGPQTRTSRSRPKTAATTSIYGYGDDEIICAISESRGVSPTVGLSFVNLTTSDAILCQFVDTQTYARTCHKIVVHGPSEILYTTTAEDSKLLSVLRENLDAGQGGPVLTSLDRRYWSQSTGFDHVQRLALPDDLNGLKLSLEGNSLAVCCFAAVLRYVDSIYHKMFAAQSLRIHFESSEGAMMIDVSTIRDLELVSNLQDSKSKDSLFGHLNKTYTKMGARFLRSNILQPSTNPSKIAKRHAAVEELSNNGELLSRVREAMKGTIDTDSALTALVLLPTKSELVQMENSANNVLKLKTFIDCIRGVWQSLFGVGSEELTTIRDLCFSQNYIEVETSIKHALNDDVSYSKNPTDLRNQRVYAIRAGVNSFLDVARQTYSEITQDVNGLVGDLQEQYGNGLDLKYDPSRHYYLRLPAAMLDLRQMPDGLINAVRHNKFVECQTLELVKLNQKIRDAHNEVILMSDKTIQHLIDEIRPKLFPLFKISEAFALLDMLATFALLQASGDYTRPELTETLALQDARHPIRDVIHRMPFVPNDVYSSRQSRFQIITGCNMSGKSTYIRTIALLAVMAQIGCFVPAKYASVPMFHQMFARISIDDGIEANVSTFAIEMREMAHILRNIGPHALVIIDELGRGTSTDDGLAIAIAISEALIESEAAAWFVTHFRDLPKIFSDRPGVNNLHMAVELPLSMALMRARYKVVRGPEEQKHYGLALAQLASLPSDVTRIAKEVSIALNLRNEGKKTENRVRAAAAKRKLALRLKEGLGFLTDGLLENEEMLSQLTQLQQEYKVRTSAIEAEMGIAGLSSRHDSKGSEAEIWTNHEIPSTCTSSPRAQKTPDTNINTDKLIATSDRQAEKRSGCSGDDQVERGFFRHDPIVIEDD